MTTTYVVNNVNEYTSSTTNGVTTTYQYDADGNLIAQTVGGSTTTYTFNELNELTAVSGPGLTASYGYDPLGNLISQTVNGVTTNYQIDPTGLGNVVATFSGSGNLTGPLHLRPRSGQPGQRHRQSPAITTSTLRHRRSASRAPQGSYVNQYSYLPFGQATTISAAVANPFTFVGQSGVTTRWDRQSRYAGSRVRPDRPGSSCQHDPLGLGGGDTNLASLRWQ